MSKDGGSPLPGGGAQDSLLHLMATHAGKGTGEPVLAGGSGAGGQEAGPQGVVGRLCTVVLMALASIGRQGESRSKKIE